MSPKVLISSYNWPPRNAIGTHRPYAWARHWSEAGAQVTVLTARKRFFDEPLDLHLPVLDGVHVIEVPYGKDDQSAVRRLLRSSYILGRLRRLKAALERGISTPIDPRLAWFEAALPLINSLAAEHTFVVSTFGPAASHFIANAVKQANPAIFWVADYRDLWSQHPRPTVSQATLDKVRVEEEAIVGCNADLVTAVSEDMVRLLSEFCKSDVLLVPNGFDIQESELGEALIQPFRHSSRPIRIVYTGTVYRGHQNPMPLLEVLVMMMERREIKPGDVFLDFYGRAVDSIRDLQKSPRFKPFLRLFGHVPRGDAIKAQRDSDLLLLLESPDPVSRGVLTGKVFEYITAGRPIICVGSDPEYEIGTLLRRTRTGKVLGRADNEEMASIIKERLQGTEQPAWFAPNIEEIRRYSRRTQSLILLDEMLKRCG